MGKITKRDIAILGGFVVLVAVGAMIVIGKQVSADSSTSTDPSKLLRVGVVSVPDSPIAPGGGLTLEGRDIADPRAFDPSKSGLPGIFGAAIQAGLKGGGEGGKPTEKPSGSGGSNSGGASGGPGGGAPGGGFGGPPGGGGFGPNGGQAGEARIFVAAVAGADDSIRALVVEKDGGASRWLARGESAFGYTLEYASIKGAMVVRNGQHYVLPLGKGATTRQTQGPTGPSGPATSGESGPATGDEKSAEEKLIGSWTGSAQGMTFTITYSRGGSGSISMSAMPTPMTFRWSVRGSQIHVSMSFGGQSMEDDVNFRFEDDRTLIVSGGRMGGGMGGEMRLTKK